MPGDHIGHSVLGMATRIEEIREVDREFAAAKDVPAFHERLPYFALLFPTERSRLRALFPELASEPTMTAAAHVRLAWDARARSLLLRQLDFIERTDGPEWSATLTFHHNEHHGALVLTVDGSLVSLGPPSESGRRSFRYAPIWAHTSAPRSGIGHLDEKLTVGRPVRIGRLHLSEAQLLAVNLGETRDPGSLGGTGPALRGRLLEASLFPVETNPAGRESRSLLLEYRTLLSRIAVATARERVVLECEALAHVLLLQDGAPGVALEDLAHFVTDNGTRYVVDQSARRGPVVLERISSTGDHSWLGAINIAPQRVVQGAPLVLFIESAKVAFTGLVREIVKR